ncbi:MAG TPA: TolC family protein [Bryobacteraceae bacterium]|nr:TolC family protein [Bryobacteraceae bacterium]
MRAGLLARLLFNRAILCLALLFCGCAVRQVPDSGATALGLVNRTGLNLPRQPIQSDQPVLPPGLNLDSPLSCEDAAAIAVWNNRRLYADLGALGVARADLLEAGLLRNPRFDMLFPVGAKPLEILVNFPIEMMIQRPRRLAFAQAAYDQLAESLIQNGLNTIRDACFAHADLVQATARLDIAERAADLRMQILQITEARLRAGDIGELETVLARSDVGNAQEQLARFRHDLALAQERFRLALGLSVARSEVHVGSSPAPTDPPPALEALLEKAMAARPDLRAIELSIATAAKRARWERSRVLWLTAQLSSKGIGTHGVLTGPGLSAEIPIFNHNQGLVARAEADVEIAARQYLAMKQTVAFEVAEARQLLLQAQELLRRTREQVLEPLQRGTTLAEGQYKKGDVAYLFVLEQTRGLIDAELRVVDFEAGVRRAQAQLERSVGTEYRN